MKIVTLFLCVLLIGCGSSTEVANNWKWQEICGRNDSSNVERLPVYRIKVPQALLRIDPEASISLEDTRLPLCEFIINDNEKQIKIVIHNFPKIDGKNISPLAQIARWKNQLATINQMETSVIPQAFSGFVGYLFESSENDGSKAIMAWALQLAPEHDHTLSYYIKKSESPNEKRVLNQMMSDITIKISGTKQLLKKYKQELIKFARSFELIKEIPPAP